MKRSCAAGFALFLLACSSQLSAELHSSLNGDAYYDDVLNITWLRNTNYATLDIQHPTGSMTWVEANAWAKSLEVDGVTGWRLPTMVDINNDGCKFSFSGTDCGYNVLTGSADTTVYSELASLWYDTLGNRALYDSSGNEDPAAGLVNSGPFYGSLMKGGYWTSQPYAPAGSAWFFTTNTGNQNLLNANRTLFAWAVHSGDLRLIVDAKLNGRDTSLAPGPSIPESGSAATWLYVVKNTSDSTIYNVRLYARDVEPEATEKWELLCYLDRIPAGGQATCSSESLIVDGHSKVLLSAQGTDQKGNKIVAGTPAWYIGGLGFEPSLSLDVSIDEADGDDSEPPGPGLEWNGYFYHKVNVTNNGDVILRDVRVFDRRAAPSKTAWSLTCAFEMILPGESVTCYKEINNMVEYSIHISHFTAQMTYKNQKIKDDDFSYYYYDLYDPYDH